MKRVVSSSIITLFILLAVAIAFIYLRNLRGEGGNPVEAIPTDASFFVVYSPDSANLSSLKFWKSIDQAPAFSDLKKMLLSLDSTSKTNNAFSQFISGSPLFISAHVTSASDFDFLFLKSVNSNFNESSIDKLIAELAGNDVEAVKRNYDGNVIRELAMGNNKIFTYCIAKGIFMGSYTTFVVEDALRQLKVGKPVFSNYKDSQNYFESSGFNIYLNFNNLPSLINIFTDASKSLRTANLKTFGKWVVAGTQFSNENISINGYIPQTDSSFQISCLDGQKPVAKNLLKVLPGKTAHVQYVGLSDFNLFYQKRSRSFDDDGKKLRKKKLTSQIKSIYDLDIEMKMLEWIGNEYALVITEPSGMSYDNNCYAVFKTVSKKKAETVLKSISKIVDSKSGSPTMEEVYNEYSIGLIRLNNVLPVLFGDMFNKVPGMYYTAVGDYIVFANKASALRAFIDDYRAESLFIKSESYKSLKQKLPAEGNLFYVVKPAASYYILKSIANSKWKVHADRYREIISNVNSFGFQINAGPKEHRVVASLNFSGSSREEGVSSVFSVETDSAVTMKALLTTDPVTNTRQILFQDNAEVLYLADNAGNVLWKQQLSGGGILGEIHEIDLFKNNSRQFLFNTREYMFLLDADGKPVGNYPIRLPAPATNGIAVYDFDGRKEHRIYVACENNSVYAYLASGKPLPGWVFRERTGRVSIPVRLVKSGNRDLLMVTDDSGSVFVINRFGEQAIPVTAKLFPAENTSYFTDSTGAVIFSDIQGNIIKLNASGSVETLPLNAADADHGFLFEDTDADGDRDFVFVNGNELIAYNSSLVMIYRKVFEYEMSGEIQLFTLNTGEKVMGLRSEMTDKTWLVKMNGSVMQGFPVKGSAAAVIDELNLDGNKNLFVGGTENRFYVYSLE